MNCKPASVKRCTHIQPFVLDSKLLQKPSEKKGVELAVNIEPTVSWISKNHFVGEYKHFYGAGEVL